MKKKIIIFTLVLSTLLLYGCSTTKQRPANENAITEEKAKEIALNHADLTADQVTFTKIKLDRDDYTEHYDIEFYTNDRKEYDYEIDLYTGDVLEWDAEPNRL